MDPHKDFEKANEIIKYHKNKLGLKGEYKLKIEPRLDGCAAPDFLSRFSNNINIKFDRQYFEALNEGEFRAVTVHELGHIKSDCEYYLKFVILSLPLILIFTLNGFFYSRYNIFTLSIPSLIYLLILLTLYKKIFKEIEFNADKIAGINRDLYVVEDLISAIDKVDCKKNANSLKTKIKKIFLPSHPSKKERKARLGDCSTNFTSESSENAKFLKNGRDDVKKIMLSLLGQYEEYHSHKENMAWLGTVLYLGFIFGLINFVTRYDLEKWTPLVLYIIILIAAGISGLYIEEQLKLRREAAIIVEACLSLNFGLLKESFGVSESDLEFCNGIMISEGKKFPKILQDEIDERAKEGKYPSLKKLEKSILVIIILATLLALVLTWTPRSDYIYL